MTTEESIIIQTNEILHEDLFENPQIGSGTNHNFLSVIPVTLGGEDLTKHFLMRGIDQTCPPAEQPAYVYWVVEDEPDINASQLDPGDLLCGVDPATDVIDIVVASTWRG